MALMTTGGGLIGASVALAAARFVPHVVTSPTIGVTTLWYLTRALAVGAYIALTVSILFGGIRSIARQSREHVSWVVDELHQFLAALAAVLVLGHLATLLVDPYIPFTIQNLLLPLSEPYRPFAVILGVYAVYTIVALLLTSWFRSFMPYSFWRLLHYLSFVTFVLVTAHGLLAGSDAGEPWMRAIYGGAAGAFAFVIFIRTLGGPRKSAQAKAAQTKASQAKRA